MSSRRHPTPSPRALQIGLLSALVCATAALPLRAAGEQPYRRPPVVDAHAHLGFGAQELIARVMEDNGLRLLVNLSGGSSPAAIQRAVALAKALPGKIINFYNPDWSRWGEPDFGVVEATRLELVVEQLGYRGLKISKHLGLGLREPSGMLVPVDHPDLDPLWERAGTLGVPVAIHTGDPKAFFEPATPDNERWEELSVHPSWSFAGPEFPRREELLEARDRVLARHPRTTFICVHLGNNPEDLDYVERLLERYPNAALDVSARVGEIGRHDPERVRALFVRYADRILFGTDIGMSPGHIMLGSNGAIPPTPADIRPFYEAHWRFFETHERGIAHPAPIQGDWTVDAIGLPPEVLDKFYVDNALRLLGLYTEPAR